jgi:hypothetical protein
MDMAAEIFFTSIVLTAIIAARYLVFSGLAYWLLWQRGGEKLAAKRLNRDRPMAWSSPAFFERRRCAGGRARLWRRAS